ncbi:A-kinase anchor protein inhibitor 1 isoform X1 [Rhinolophus sinicus]|uniref:A-kinase anchor protein inhibitor 1 isoform X1 n=1 Tax=Rhinolophus sinicus TaxID=89399 RepID=UPI003D79D19B
MQTYSGYEGGGTVGECFISVRSLKMSLNIRRWAESLDRKGEKPGNEPEEVKLQNASKQIVQNAIRQAVRQVSQESRQREESTSDNRGTFQLGVGELTKKHEKK